jgi:hypothetical protein
VSIPHPGYSFARALPASFTQQIKNWKEKTMANITSINITLFTDDDDKDREELVSTSVYLNQNELLAQNVRGANELWPDHTQQTFGLTLSKPVSENNSGAMRIVVTKSCHGSDTGCGWNMSVAATGLMDNGKSKIVLPQTNPVRMGDNNPVSRAWDCQ